MSEVFVSSRSFDEYVAFFGLDPARLPARVVDCCAGASSFVAEAHRRGLDAVAVDPAYTADRVMTEQTRTGAAQGVRLITDNRERFTYTWYGSPERRARLRADALDQFTRHRADHPDRYRAASLPDLPFPDASFDLAVSSHLLFTWATQLDARWHRDALLEMCRVATQVRVFPLVVQGTGEPVDFLPRLRRELLDGHGVRSETVTVPYEFQVGADQMLVLTRAAP